MARLDSKTFPVLSEETVLRLHSRNIYTVYDFMLSSNEQLKQMGLCFKEIEKIRESFSQNFGGEIVNPYDIYEQEIHDVMSTGIKNLDTILEGGLHCRQIYEICGSSAAGKSQLCHWISMYTALNESAEVHYVEASKNFCASRIQMILEAQHCSDNIIGKVMSNIKVHRIQKIHELFTIFYHLANVPTENQSNLSKKIVIVDSLSVLFALTSTKDLYPILCNFASVSRYLVNHKRASVITVNTVKSEQGPGLLSDTEEIVNVKLKPSLGNYWLGVPNVRLLVVQLENNQREISIWKSCQLEDEKKCLVVIKDEGIF